MTVLRPKQSDFAKMGTILGLLDAKATEDVENVTKNMSVVSGTTGIVI